MIKGRVKRLCQDDVSEKVALEQKPDNEQESSKWTMVGRVYQGRVNAMRQKRLGMFKGQKISMSAEHGKIGVEAGDVGRGQILAAPSSYIRSYSSDVGLQLSE